MSNVTPLGNRRYIPIDVRRALRKEAGFGCAKCGNPILDFHHIVPWSEEQHNRIEDMIALCPTHHREFGKRSASKAYELKKNPKNIETGKVHGQLVSGSSSLDFIIGSATFSNVPILIQHGIKNKRTILGHEIIGGENAISVDLPSPSGHSRLKIFRNDMMANIGDAWDIEFRSNYLKFIYQRTDEFIEIDMRDTVSKVSARFFIGSFLVDIRPGANFVSAPDGGYISFSGSKVSDCPVGIFLGDAGY